MKKLLAAGILAAAVPAFGTAVHADVKTQEKSLVRFEGMLGRVVGLFGGRAAREGVVTTVAVRGDRKMTRSDYGGQIIDLAEEKIYDLDVRGKTYQVTTFDEMRRRLEEAQRKAAEEAARASKDQPREAPPEPGQKEVEVDFDLKESGQRKNVNGHDAREIVMTIAVREKGKTLEESGGIVMTANSWLAPEIPGMKEVAEFDRRYFEKIQGPFGLGDASQMAAALAMYPGLKQALERFQAESVNLDGTAVQTVVRFEAARSKEQVAEAQAQDQDQERPAGMAGVLGGIAGRMRRSRDADQQAAGTAGRATILTMTHDVLKVTQDVTPEDVAIPAGFREKK